MELFVRNLEPAFWPISVLYADADASVRYVFISVCLDRLFSETIFQIAHCNRGYKDAPISPQKRSRGKSAGTNALAS